MTTRQPVDESAETAVTVSIPYYRCGPYIRRAVESILAQTHRNLTVVVVNDGDTDGPWNQLADIDDPRLVRFDLRANHGRYFADEVVRRATADPYFVIQDADDWSDPRRIETALRHLRAEHADAVATAHLHHTSQSGRGIPRKAPARLVAGISERYQHRFAHQCVFRTAALDRIGGYYAGFRISHDTLLMNLMLMTGRVIWIEEPLYHRLRRPDSLVNSPATGLRSTARRRAAGEQRAMYASAWAWYRDYLAGQMGEDELADRIREMCVSRVSADDRRQLEAESARLAEVMRAERRGVREEINANIPGPTGLDGPVGRSLGVVATLDQIDSLINGNRLEWSSWTITRPVATELARRIVGDPPRRVLEIGSGNTTVLLAALAARLGFEVISLEHDRQYWSRTRRLLANLRLSSHVDLRYAPLREMVFGDGLRYPWYDSKLAGAFDFIFVDGPPARYGRQAALLALRDRLEAGWELWLNDGNRSHERACVELWNRSVSFDSRLMSVDEKGVWVLNDIAAHALDARIATTGRIAMSLLTGSRPNLLERTLDALQSNLGSRLDDFFVVAMVNGSDRESLALVEQLSFVDALLDGGTTIQPIGAAASQLIGRMLDEPGIDYVFHLEDDWALDAPDSNWLRDAQRILEEQPRIGQVRLRRSDERVLPNHMVTAKPIRWEERPGYRYSASAHFTFQPSLIRASDAPSVYPCRSERDAQRRFLATGLGTAQLLPGVFSHIGVHQSLRVKLGR